MKATDLFKELKLNKTSQEIADLLYLHLGTVKRWELNDFVPENYYNDLNSLLDYKYPQLEDFRKNDQFFTSKKTAQWCFNELYEILNKLDINHDEYTFIEPSAGCCSFYELMPSNRRIGIDIDPKGELKNELIRSDYLKFFPPKGEKYIVLGNPPFGLRGNLALRFINHSYDFADIVAFILPPLFDSTGKGVPMKRVKGYKLAYSVKLPRNSFEYPDGTLVNVATIFQVWTKIKTELLDLKETKTCNTYMKVYSLSDGGTPSSTRNKKMIDKCDVYLPSTCFTGMKAYDSFESLPNRRGYGVVFFKEKEKLIKLFFSEINWEQVSFESTNGALNLRTDLICNQLIERGYQDE